MLKGVVLSCWSPAAMCCFSLSEKIETQQLVNGDSMVSLVNGDSMVSLDNGDSMVSLVNGDSMVSLWVTSSYCY